MTEQAIVAQQLETLNRAAALKEFQYFVEQPRRRNLFEEMAHRHQRRFAVAVEAEAELGGETHGPQHAHRVFAITLLWIADQPQHAGLQILHAVDENDDGEILDVVIERVDGEVAPLGNIFDGDVDYVEQEAAGLG